MYVMKKKCARQGIGQTSRDADNTFFMVKTPISSGSIEVNVYITGGKNFMWRYFRSRCSQDALGHLFPKWELKTACRLVAYVQFPCATRSQFHVSTLNSAHHQPWPSWCLLTLKKENSP